MAIFDTQERYLDIWEVTGYSPHTYVRILAAVSQSQPDDIVYANAALYIGIEQLGAFVDCQDASCTGKLVYI